MSEKKRWAKLAGLPEPKEEKQHLYENEDINFFKSEMERLTDEVLANPKISQKEKERRINNIKFVTYSFLDPNTKGGRPPSGFQFNDSWWSSVSANTDPLTTVDGAEDLLRAANGSSFGDNDIPLDNPPTSLNENFVGHQMVGNMFDREKEKYESSFEYFLSEKYEPTTESDSMDEEMEMGGEMETDKMEKGGEINLPNGVFIDTRKTTQSKDEILEMYSNQGYTAIGGGSLLSDNFKKYNRDIDIYIVVGEIKHTSNNTMKGTIYMEKNEVAVQNFIPKNIDAKVITKIHNTDSGSTYAKGGEILKEKYESSFEYFLSEKYEATTESDSIDEEMGMGEEMETDKIDIVTMDVPLFIRVLEYSREDAQADMDLHELAEKAIAATKQQGILSMDDYNMLTGELEQIGEENEEK